MQKILKGLQTFHFATLDVYDVQELHLQVTEQRRFIAAGLNLNLWMLLLVSFVLLAAITHTHTSSLIAC